MLILRQGMKWPVKNKRRPGQKDGWSENDRFSSTPANDMVDGDRPGAYDSNLSRPTRALFSHHREELGIVYMHILVTFFLLWKQKQAGRKIGKVRRVNHESTLQRQGKRLAAMTRARKTGELDSSYCSGSAGGYEISRSKARGRLWQLDGHGEETLNSQRYKKKRSL